MRQRQRRANSIVAGVMHIVHAALHRRFNSGSALCGKTTRDYTFITATRPPPLVEADKLLLAYQGPKQHPTASKLGANRLEAPINIPNSQICHTPDAHFLYSRLYRFMYNAVLTASLICLISRNYRRYG
jgi:hypothetical protein